jgi:hypothetical protein
MEITQRPAEKDWSDLKTVASQSKATVPLLLVEYFKRLFETEFNAIDKSKSQDCAIVAAFLQCTIVFDNLFKSIGDRRLLDGYFDTLIECLRDDLPVKNILSRTFCRLMSGHGFQKDHHVVTFIGDAGGSFTPVIKNKLLFKDLIGVKHGQYTHTIQWFGVCLLAENQGIIEGGLRLSCSVSDLYAYIVDLKSTHTFPGESLGEKAKPNMQRTLWDFCVDCFQDRNDAENPAANLYTASYRSPANITEALETGALSNTFMADYMRRRIGKYKQKLLDKGKTADKLNASNVFSSFIKGEQKDKGRSVYTTTKGFKKLADINAQKDGVLWIVTDSKDEEFLENLLNRVD